MRALLRPCGAILGLTLSCLPSLAQNAPPPPPAAAAPSAPATPSAPAAPANAVAATVNGQPITELAVRRGLSRVPADKQGQERPKIINYLIDQTLRDQYLAQLQIPFDPKEVDKYVDEMKAEVKKRNQDFAKMLQEIPLTEAELREHIAADLRWGKFADERANDKVLRQLFESQKSLFDGSTVRARHILLMVPDEDAKAGEQVAAQLLAVKQQIEKQVADELAKLPADADNLTREKKRQTLIEEAFAAQAKEKSACPTKAQGGDVGPPFQGVGFMVEPFAEAAFALKPYEISQPVKTPFGYHLILITERKPGREVKFEDVKEMVKEHYCAILHSSIVSEARAKSKIVINK